jgi:hypothetical protein
METDPTAKKILEVIQEALNDEQTQWTTVSLVSQFSKKTVSLEWYDYVEPATNDAFRHTGDALSKDEQEQ